jgi:hypothetical protein
MKYAVIYTLNFTEIGLGIQKLIGGDSQTHRQHGYCISLLPFFENKESGLKMENNLVTAFSVLL